MWLSHLDLIPLGICKQMIVSGVTLWSRLDCTLIVARKWGWCQGKMRRQNLLLKIEAGYKEMNEYIQHLAGDLVYLVKWSSTHSAGSAGSPCSVNPSEKLPWHNKAVRIFQLRSRNSRAIPQHVLQMPLEEQWPSWIPCLSAQPKPWLWDAQKLVVVLHCPEALLRICEIIGTNLAPWPVDEIWLTSRWLGEKWVLPVWICPTDALSHLGASVPREMCFAS